MKMISEFTEEYLEALLTLSASGSPVKTNELARHFNISPASVTEMVQRLYENGYVKYRKYYGATLTEKGREVATRIKRRHRLLERFLTDILDIEKGDVHELACRMEHTLSKEIEQRLCRLLDHPEMCPDDRQEIGPCEYGLGECETCGNVNILSLSSLNEGESAVIRAVLEDHLSQDMLFSLGIRPEKELKYLGIRDGVRTYLLDGSSLLALDEKISKRVLVQRSG